MTYQAFCKAITIEISSVSVLTRPVCKAGNIHIKWHPYSPSDRALATGTRLSGCRSFNVFPSRTKLERITGVPDLPSFSYGVSRSLFLKFCSNFQSRLQKLFNKNSNKKAGAITHTKKGVVITPAIWYLAFGSVAR